MVLGMPLLTRLLDELSELGEIEDRPALGGWELRLEGRTFALVQGERVWFRTDQRNRLDYQRAGSMPYSPNPSMESGRFYEVPGHVVVEPDTLRAWARRAIETQ